MYETELAEATEHERQKNRALKLLVKGNKKKKKGKGKKKKGRGGNKRRSRK
jgi:hypothetical protein